MKDWKKKHITNPGREIVRRNRRYVLKIHNTWVEKSLVQHIDTISVLKITSFLVANNLQKKCVEIS